MMGRVDQNDLFDTRRNFKKAGTSSDAAEAAAPKASYWRERVLQTLTGGAMTPDEIAAAVGADILTIRPRCSELLNAGMIEPTGARRPTPRGRSADVLQLVKANPSKRTDARRHKIRDRKNDLYETPPQATRALLRTMHLPPQVWEPACGPGAIVRVMRDAGHICHATDLVDYGCPDSQAGIDFLMETTAPCDTIVTNPPFKMGDAFVRKGLQLCTNVIILNRLSYMEGAGRSDIMEHLARVYVGIERLPMMHREGWDGPKVKTGAMQFAWFVFTRAKPKETITKRISWREG